MHRCAIQGCYRNGIRRILRTIQADIDRCPSGTPDQRKFPYKPSFPTTLQRPPCPDDISKSYNPALRNTDQPAPLTFRRNARSRCRNHQSCSADAIGHIRRNAHTGCTLHRSTLRFQYFRARSGHTSTLGVMAVRTRHGAIICSDRIGSLEVKNDFSSAYLIQ